MGLKVVGFGIWISGLRVIGLALQFRISGPIRVKSFICKVVFGVNWY